MSKLPTAAESYRKHRRYADNLPVSRRYSEYKVIIDSINYHTQAHTEAIREENATLEKYNSLLIEEKETIRGRVKELKAENARYRDRIGEALKFLQSRQQTTPVLGAPVTILKQALDK